MALNPVLTRHKQLLTTISDEIGNEGDEYTNFVEHFKGYVPRGLLQSKKTLLGKFDALASKGYLKPGKYEVLKKICEDSGNKDILELVIAAETDINELSNTRTDGNGHQTTTDTGQSSSRHTPLQSPPVQETVNDTAGPSSKRARKDTAEPSNREQTEVDNPDQPYYTDEKQHGYYDTSEKQGMLLILNSYENRKGTEKDLENLKGFFGDKGLGFHVYNPRGYAGEDLTTGKVFKVLSDARTVLNGDMGKQYYCFICVIMSHGNEKGIKTRDGLILVKDIRHYFNNKNMPTFTGRPKAFFIQACRGTSQQDSQEVDDADDEKRPEAGQDNVADEADRIIHVPTDADTLLAYATTPGYLSFRRLGVGSWFITECINVFKEYHKRDHLEDMLITVREKVALHWKKQDGTKQMPCVWSTLTKRLKLTKNHA